MFSPHFWFFTLLFMMSLGTSNLCLSAQLSDHDWRWWAGRLTLGDKARSDALLRLKANPHLEKQLRAALSTNEKYLAFDTIAALKFHAFLPELLNKSVQNNENGSGYFYLAIDSLLEPTDIRKISAIYQDRLFEPGTSEAARVVILDTLSRMSLHLAPSELQRLISADSPPELRKAALSYLRDFLLDSPRASDLEILKQLLSDPEVSERLRLQALFLTSELSQKPFDDLGKIKLVCSRSYSLEIQLVCQRLNRK